MTMQSGALYCYALQQAYDEGGGNTAAVSAAIKGALKDEHSTHLGYLGGSELESVAAGPPWIDANLGPLP